MFKLIHMITAATAIALSGCANVHTLVPERASAGWLDHTSATTGKLELTYAGKTYSGEFGIERPRSVDGEYQRHRGYMAKPSLVAPDGDWLHCEMQWPQGGAPGGLCKTASGSSFDVRFN
jgi:hypothetical protein